MSKNVMNVAQREFCMGVAGVRLWYARTPLPGAAPSHDFDMAVAEEPTAGAVAGVGVPASVAPHRPPSDASRQGLATLQGLLAGTTGGAVPRELGEEGVVQVEAGVAGHSPATAEPSRVASESELAVPEAEPASDCQVEHGLSGIAVSFHWRFWVGEKWLLVSRCSDTATRGLEDRLASNILRALDDVVIRTEALRWPVFSNPAVPGNDALGASGVVAAMAESVIRPGQLWLGLESEDPDPEVSGIWPQLAAPLGKATVSFPATLAALSSDPEGKRSLWRALQQTERL